MTSTKNGGRRIAAKKIRLRPGRLFIACAIVLVIGLGGAGTLAYWSDTDTLSPGTFTTGTLDLRLGGELAGPDGTWQNVEMTVADMMPGESQAFEVDVQNAGDAMFRYTVQATATGDFAPALRFSVHPAGSASNGGEGDLRRGSCSAEPSFPSGQLAPSTRVVSTDDDRVLAPGEEEPLCIVVALPEDAGEAFAATTATAAFQFAAIQVSHG